MKKYILNILFIFYFSLQSVASDYLKIIFKSKENVPEITKKDNSEDIKFHDNKLNEIFKKYKISKFEREYPIADSFPDNVAPAVRLRLVYQVRVLGDLKEKIKSLKDELDLANSPDISTVIKTNDPISLTTPPNDYYNCFACTTGNWPQAHHHLDLVNALGAWEITKGLSCIKIGITDENFQHHPDLDNKVDITPRTAYIAAANSFLSHGTEVAGMAGAETNNNVGISSLGYNTRLQYYTNDYPGIVNAIYDKCKVINCSWGTSCSSTLQPPPNDIKDVLQLAELNNVTIVAAAGNGYDNPIAGCRDPSLYVYPASYDGVISVTSVGSQNDVGHPDNANWKDCHREFTSSTDSQYYKTAQHNDRVDICAPGYWVETTLKNNSYGNDGGTSLAAPIVSAAAALLYSINPLFTPSQIKGYLKNSAANIYGIYDNYLWAGKLGAGRLDARASLQAALSNAYNGEYCNSCPSETTYVTYASDPLLNPLSGFFYNKDIYAGSNNSKLISTGTFISTTLIATNSITLTPEFKAVASGDIFFSARIQPCITGSAPNRASNKIIAVEAVEADESLIKKEQIKVFPNPAKSIITIISQLDTKQIDIDLINNTGVVIKRIHKSIGKLNSDKTEVDVKSLSSGLYYIIVRSGAKTYFGKFVKVS